MSQRRILASFLAAAAIATCAGARESVLRAAPPAPVIVEAPESPTSRKAGEAYAAAIALAQDGDLPGAIQSYTTVIALEPTFAQAHFERGVLKAQTKDLNGAIIDLANAASRAPRLSWLRSQALYERARALAATLDFSRAVSDASDSLTNRPDFTDALALRAMAQNELGQPYLALDDANDALGLEPSHAGARLERARALIALRKPDPAITDLGTLIDSLEGAAPGSPDGAMLVGALVARAKASDSIGHIRPAIDDFGAAIALDPRCYDALVGRALSLSRLGRHAEAVADCQRAIACAPPFTRADTPAHRLLPRLQEFAGQSPATAAVPADR